MKYSKIEEIDSRDSFMGGNFARQAIKEVDEILKAEKYKQGEQG